ncbi:unnamed protein product, partial [Staurois parvus]
SSHSHRACAAQGARSVAIGGALCPSDTVDRRSQKEPKMSARSCDQLCPITADHSDHHGTDDQCNPRRATCQCLVSVPRASAYQYHVSVPTSAHQCCLSVPCISAAFQYPSVMPVYSHQCHLPVQPIS